MIYCVKGFWEIHEDSSNMLTYKLRNIVYFSFYESQMTWLIVSFS